MKNAFRAFNNRISVHFLSVKVSSVHIWIHAIDGKRKSALICSRNSFSQFVTGFLIFSFVNVAFPLLIELMYIRQGLRLKMPAKENNDLRWRPFFGTIYNWNLFANQIEYQFTYHANCGKSILHIYKSNMHYYYYFRQSSYSILCCFVPLMQTGSLHFLIEFIAKACLIRIAPFISYAYIISMYDVRI